MELDAATRWRLILGEESNPKNSIPLNEEETGMDKALAYLYDQDEEGERPQYASGKKGGSQTKQSPLSTWLKEVTDYFPEPVVQIIKRDALQRLGIVEVLSSPEMVESMEADFTLATTILQLQHLLPDHTRHSARMVIQKLVDRLLAELKPPTESAVRGVLRSHASRRQSAWKDLHSHRTIQRNLKHYQPAYKTIIPEIRVGFQRLHRQQKDLFIVCDQSASMAGSLVYAGVFGSVLAQLPATNTRLFTFDTRILEWTHQLHDPTGILLGVQMGGGTHIALAMQHVEQLVEHPTDSTIFLLSDLYDGMDETLLPQIVFRQVQAGIRIVVLLALTNTGTPDYDAKMATQLTQAGAVCLACTPHLFPQLIAAVLEGKSLDSYAYE